MKSPQKKNPAGGRGKSERGSSATEENLTGRRALRQCCVCGCHFPQRPGPHGDLICLDCDGETESWEERR